MGVTIKKQKIESKAEAIMIMIAIAHANNWNKIMKFMADRKRFSDEEIELFTQCWNASGYQWHCIARDDYPIKYKFMDKPPFFVHESEKHFIPRKREYEITHSDDSPRTIH